MVVALKGLYFQLRDIYKFYKLSLHDMVNFEYPTYKFENCLGFFLMYIVHMAGGVFLYSLHWTGYRTGDWSSVQFVSRHVSYCPTILPSPRLVLNNYYSIRYNNVCRLCTR